jgi:hypothetical protein
MIDDRHIRPGITGRPRSGIPRRSATDDHHIVPALVLLRELC